MHMFYCCYVIDWQKTKFLEKLTISEKHLCFSMMLNDNVLHVYCNVCLEICLPSEFRNVTGALYFEKKFLTLSLKYPILFNVIASITYLPPRDWPISEGERPSQLNTQNKNISNRDTLPQFTKYFWINLPRGVGTV